MSLVQAAARPWADVTQQLHFICIAVQPSTDLFSVQLPNALRWGWGPRGPELLCNAALSPQPPQGQMQADTKGARLEGRSSCTQLSRAWGQDAAGHHGTSQTQQQALPAAFLRRAAVRDAKRCDVVLGWQCLFWWMNLLRFVHLSSPKVHVK